MTQCEVQVKNATARYTAEAGAGMVSVVLDFETLVGGAEKILQRFRSVINQYGSRIKLAVIEDITSNPTCHMPLKQLLELFNAADIMGESALESLSLHNMTS